MYFIGNLGKQQISIRIHRKRASQTNPHHLGGEDLFSYNCTSVFISTRHCKYSSIRHCERKRSNPSNAQIPARLLEFLLEQKRLF